MWDNVGSVRPGIRSNSTAKGIANRQTALYHLAVVEFFGIERVAPRFESCGDDRTIVDRVLVAFGNPQSGLVRLDGDGRGLRTKDAQNSQCVVDLLPILVQF